MGAAAIDPRTFRHVLGQFCTGVTVITTVHDEVPIGFACQSFAALSLDPPLVLFCPTKQSRAWQAIELARTDPQAVEAATRARAGLAPAQTITASPLPAPLTPRPRIDVGPTGRPGDPRQANER